MAKRIKVSDSQMIEVSTFKNKQGRFLNVRKFYKTKGSDEWLPTKQGITIPEENVLRVLKAMKLEFQDIDNAEELDDSGDKKKSKSKSKSKSKRKGNDDE